MDRKSNIENIVNYNEITSFEEETKDEQEAKHDGAKTKPTILNRPLLTTFKSILPKMLRPISKTFSGNLKRNERSSGKQEKSSKKGGTGQRQETHKTNTKTSNKTDESLNITKKDKEDDDGDGDEDKKEDKRKKKPKVDVEETSDEDDGKEDSSSEEDENGKFEEYEEAFKEKEKLKVYSKLPSICKEKVEYRFFPHKGFSNAMNVPNDKYDWKENEAFRKNLQRNNQVRKEH